MLAEAFSVAGAWAAFCAVYAIFGLARMYEAVSTPCALPGLTAATGHRRLVLAADLRTGGGCPGVDHRRRVLRSRCDRRAFGRGECEPFRCGCLRPSRRRRSGRPARWFRRGRMGRGRRGLFWLLAVYPTVSFALAGPSCRFRSGRVVDRDRRRFTRHVERTVVVAGGSSHHRSCCGLRRPDSPIRVRGFPSDGSFDCSFWFSAHSC